jgi:hypothetical protein
MWQISMVIGARRGRAYAWAAVTLKRLSLRLKPAATKEQPRTSRMLERMEPSI